MKKVNLHVCASSNEELFRPCWAMSAWHSSATFCKCTILVSLYKFHTGTLSLCGSYAMLTRSNKTETAVHDAST